MIGEIGSFSMQVKNKKIGLKRSFLFRITFPVIFIIVLCYLMQSDFGIEIIFGENVNTNHWRNYQTTTFLLMMEAGGLHFLLVLLSYILYTGFLNGQIDVLHAKAGLLIKFWKKR
tara:strand:- start:112 stop:456 length:345 start_codon:yes stop_codon:yes gene_type:complete